MQTNVLYRILLGSSLIGASSYFTWVGVHVGSDSDKDIALGFAVKLVISSALALLVAWRKTPATSETRLVRYLVDGCEHHPRAVLVGVAVVTFALAWATTPEFRPESGPYDSIVYWNMTIGLARHEYHAPTPFAFRPLLPLLVHASGLGISRGYVLLNTVAHALNIWLVFRIVRRLGHDRFHAIVAAALVATIKFGLKFSVYDPLLNDAIGHVFLLAAIDLTLARRPMASALVVTVGVFCRENVVVVVLFHVLHALRFADRRRMVATVALQFFPFAAVVVSRLYPIFTPEPHQGSWNALHMWGERLFFEPSRLSRAFFAWQCSLGVLAALALLRLRDVVHFARANYEWGAYLVASLLLGLLGGSDVDRFAVWLAMPLTVAVLNMWDARKWLYGLALHGVAMELFLPWSPNDVFYRSRFVVHAGADTFGYLTISAFVLIVAVAVLSSLRRNI